MHWEKITGARNEALDCFVMCLGAREIVSRIDLTQRENELRNISPALALKTVHRSKWMQGER